MASSLSRKLFPTSSRLLFQNPTPKTLPFHSYPFPKLPLIKPFPNPNFPFSTSTPTPNPNPNTENPNPNFQHQEIVGPTVPPDTSPLATETRHVITSLRKSLYTLSSSLALLSFAHLGLGAHSVYYSDNAIYDHSFIQGMAAFAVPFSTAFLMRRSLKDIGFFQKMEEQGRLQVLTLSLQSLKSLNVLFCRVRIGVVCCIVGIAGGAFVTLWFK